jgi:Phosphatidylethanolamine-binding protein
MSRRINRLAALMALILVGNPALPSADELRYGCSKPPLEAIFQINGGHYAGSVNCGNLFLQPDIRAAPTVRWRRANPAKLYVLMMLDFDGNANGSWPDPVPPGNNSPVRHWVVGNIPGDLLSVGGYKESDSTTRMKQIQILQPYRAPHIPMVSDRYGIYLFEQAGIIDFAPMSGAITNFDYSAFCNRYNLTEPKVSNYFVAIYASKSPFSGKPFSGNDVSTTWHRDYGKGRLLP